MLHMHFSGTTLRRVNNTETKVDDVRTVYMRWVTYYSTVHMIYSNNIR